MKNLIVNRRARYEYEVINTLVTGIVLTGPEVKMLRQRKGSLAGSHVRVIGDELFLLNAQIPPYPYARQEDYDPKHTRKLLAKKNEILNLLQAQDQKGRTLIPLSIGLDGKFIKVKVAVAKGKAEHDRRRDIRSRDLARQTARDLKHSGY